jgi:hypothetical protein
MKEIIEITQDGIDYIDDDGNRQFISFEVCFQNNLKKVGKHIGLRSPEQRRKLYERMRYVGVRYTFEEPPSIQFYTEPPTRFEFATLESLYEIAYKVKKAGWRTNDGE